MLLLWCLVELLLRHLLLDRLISHHHLVSSVELLLHGDSSHLHAIGRRIHHHHLLLLHLLLHEHLLLQLLLLRVCIETVNVRDKLRPVVNRSLLNLGLRD